MNLLPERVKRREEEDKKKIIKKYGKEEYEKFLKEEE